MPGGVGGDRLVTGRPYPDCAVVPLRYGAQTEQRLLVRHFIPLAYIGHLVVLAALTWGL